jgi:hypothetical protein
MSHNYEAQGPDTAALKAQGEAWEKNIYKPFEKEVLSKVKDQIKAGGYHGNLDGDHSVSEIAESITRTLCALSNGDPKRADPEAIKNAVQKRMEELDYDGHHSKTGGYQN